MVGAQFSTGYGVGVKIRIRINLKSKKMKLDLTKITYLEFEGIDFKDSPDFCDAFITKGIYDGRKLKDAELDHLNDNEPDFLHQRLMDFIN